MSVELGKKQIGKWTAEGAEQRFIRVFCDGEPTLVAKGMVVPERECAFAQIQGGTADILFVLDERHAKRSFVEAIFVFAANAVI